MTVAVSPFCVRRSALKVFLATVTASNMVAKALSASIALAGLAALVALFITGGDAGKIVTGIISISIILVFSSWFAVNTLRRGVRVKQVVAQNIEDEKGFG